MSIDTSTTGTGTYTVTVNGSTAFGDIVAVGEATFTVPGACIVVGVDGWLVEGVTTSEAYRLLYSLSFSPLS